MIFETKEEGGTSHTGTSGKRKVKGLAKSRTVVPRLATSRETFASFSFHLESGFKAERIMRLSDTREASVLVVN